MVDMGHSIMVWWVGFGLGQGVHFASYYDIIDLHLLWTGGGAVIPRARCHIFSLDNRPISCSRPKLTRAVSPAI